MLLDFRTQIESELKSILAWWIDNMVDEKNGGFYGRIDGDNILHPEADKGVILNTRILWTFSRAALIYKDKTYRQVADRAYRYIADYFIDNHYGGLYWSLDYNGNPLEPKKQMYAQAFGIYALSEYFLLTNNIEAIDKAINLFKLIELYGLDKEYGGYIEAFSREWVDIADIRLSEKDLNASKTMNTHLHIMEAYANLHRVVSDESTEKAIEYLVRCIAERFINPQNKHLHLFFDDKWNSLDENISYGHDIECSWLMLESAEILNNEALISKIEALSLDMARVTLDEAIDSDGAVLYEYILHEDKSELDRELHWWVQAEAVIGFFNAYQLSGDNAYLDASVKCWTFIKEKLVDTEKGEWRWSVDKDGAVNIKDDKAGPWKAPYHNARMCMELIARIDTFST